MHVKQQIIDAACSILRTDKTLWKYVYPTRLHPDRDTLPYLLVYSPTESVTDSDLCDEINNRAINLVIEGYVRIPTDRTVFERSLNDISERIENLLVYSTAVQEIDIKDIDYQGSDSDVIEDENSRVMGVISLNYNVVAFTRTGDSSNLL